MRIFISRSLAWLGRQCQAVLRLVGIDVYRRKLDHHYVPDHFGKTAYKQIDVRGLKPFGELAGTAINGGRTLLHYDRLYTIYQALSHAVKQLPADAPINLAEVGVYRGGTSRFMLEVAQVQSGRTARLHCFDTFQGHDERDVVEGRDLPAVQAPGSFSNTAASAVAEYLDGAGEVELAIGRFQDTCDSYAGRQFCFAHLDVDLYEPTKAALEFFARHMVSGGAIVVDDCGIKTCPGVMLAVDEFIAANPSVFRVHLLSGQCLLHLP